MRNFLWDGLKGDNSSHLVSWEVVARPKGLGGLGIGNLLLMNKVLLGKLWVHFQVEEDAMWHKFIKSTYGLQENRWVRV